MWHPIIGDSSPFFINTEFEWQISRLMLNWQFIFSCKIWWNIATLGVNLLFWIGYDCIYGFKHMNVWRTVIILTEKENLNEIIYTKTLTLGESCFLVSRYQPSQNFNLLYQSYFKSEGHVLWNSTEVFHFLLFELEVT